MAADCKGRGYRNQTQLFQVSFKLIFVRVFKYAWSALIAVTEISRALEHSLEALIKSVSISAT